MPIDQMWFTISENLLEHSIATQKFGIVTRITEQLADLKARIQAAAALQSGISNPCRILAVSKKAFDRVHTRVRSHAGLRHFGENYVQEALTKIPEAGRRDVSGISLAGFSPTRLARSRSTSIGCTRCAINVSPSACPDKGLMKPETLQICIQIRPLNADCEDWKIGEEFRRQNCLNWRNIVSLSCRACA